MPRIQLAAAALIALSSCAAPPAAVGTDPVGAKATAPIAGFVTDLSAFDAFIASQPTPEQFKARYPDVTLALPGSINSKEMRMNNSRYFAQLDAQGRITGGKFQ